MEWRKRAFFWMATAAVLALISVPSVEWVSSLRDYARLADDWQPAPLKPSRSWRLPHRTPRNARLEAPALVSVEFRFKARKAKAVELVGDFNAWKPGLLKMRKDSEGNWALSAPLQPGAHKYLFLVDGDPRVDPGAPTTDGPEGRRVSLKTVK